MELFGLICSPENLQKAYRKVRSNAKRIYDNAGNVIRLGTAGVDGVTVDQFKANLDKELSIIRVTLLNDRYRPQPVKRVFIDKDPLTKYLVEAGYEEYRDEMGNWEKTRPLGIPTVKGRIVQQAILQVLEQLFEARFDKNSYGYRQGRSTYDAISAASGHMVNGLTHALAVDIQGFFDNVNHDILLTRVRSTMDDPRVLALIGKICKAPIAHWEEGRWRYEKSVKGVPQGGPLSPLLANIYLDTIDRELRARRHTFIRYADDLLVLTRSMGAAKGARSLVKQLLEKSGLEMNVEKTKILKPTELNFLGFTIREGRPAMPTSAVGRAQKLVLQEEGKRLGNLMVKLKGLKQYYARCENVGPLEEVIRLVANDPRKAA